MSILDTIYRRLGLATRGEVSRAYEAGFLDANDEPPSGDLASFGYTKRSTTQGLRDFSKMTNDKLIEVAWTLYQSNPLAKRYLEITRDHILGRGVQLQIEDERLMEIVEDFWERNKLNERLEKFVIDQRLFGELILTAFVRQSDGRVTLGFIDPINIDHVVTHPENVLERYAVVMKKDTNGNQRVYRIIRKDEGFIVGDTVVNPINEDILVTSEQAAIEPWEQAMLAELGLAFYSGSCFYFSVNNVSNQPRGFSDLLTSADWMDAEDETLFALADREQFAGYFSWDVTVEGMSPEQVKEYAKEISMRVPRKGQTNVHNAQEQWEMNIPDLKQRGSIDTAGALTDKVWGTALGMPITWRGMGDNANRASSLMMNSPTHRTLEHKQKTFKRDVLEIVTFVANQAQIAGAWNGEPELDLMLPEMAKVDTSEVTQTLSQLAQALMVAKEDLKVITRETAAEAIAKVLAEIGIEYDVTEELEAVDQAAEDEEMDTADAANAFLANQLAMQGMNGNGDGTEDLDNG